MQPGRPTAGYPADTPDFETIAHLLDAVADECPDRNALICGTDRLTYTQYRRSVAGMAERLGRMCAPGDRVAVVMGNSIDMAVTLLGIYVARLQSAPLNPGLTDRELVTLLDDVAPRVILCSPEHADRLASLAAAARRRLEIVGAGSDLDHRQWSADERLRLPADRPTAGDRCTMFFTGGTTGLPKGAAHVHSAFRAYCRQTYALWRFRIGQEVILNVAPMFHIWGHHFTIVFPLFLRATMVIVPAYSPDAVIEQLESHAVTIFAGGPAAIFMGLLASEAIDRADLSALEYSIAGGSPCPESLLTRWKAQTGNDILEGWGMSEGAPINLNPTYGPRKPLSTGPTPPDTEIDIVDLETGSKVLPVGERGEIRVRGPQFTTGYHNRPEESAAALRDGWLYTGDIGYFDEDGYMFLVDRKKELILVGGYNVYPREVDEVLAKHPAVAEAATIGVPDAFLGEAVVAVVVAAKGTALSEESLAGYCEKNLVRYKRPKRFVFMDALPKAGPGKIDKRALRRRFSGSRRGEEIEPG